MSVRIDGRWTYLGRSRVSMQGEARLPAIAISVAGAYAIRITGPVHGERYLRVVATEPSP
jgi:hypothetical protein